MDQENRGGRAQSHFLVSPTFQNDFIYKIVEGFLLVERDFSGKGFIIQYLVD